MADGQDTKSYGTAIVNTNKASPKSYDLKGTIEVDGTKYRFGACKSTASGKGKLPEGAPYYWMHRVEKLEMNSEGESFDPAALE